MRGGTSKGLYFRAGDLPADRATRDRVLLAAMGSPDPRQIDGLGGAHPLTSKVAIVGPSSRPDADVDYLFLQVVGRRGAGRRLRRTAATCSPASARSRSSTGLVAGAGRRDAGAHPHGQHAAAWRSRSVADAAAAR